MTKGNTFLNWGYYIHPEDKSFLLDGFPRWSEAIRDEKYTKSSSINDVLENYV
ncbi:hypothetical protein [Peribacillus simplex]|uniref:hypothetical protein n=1 Tax=Peribacillus simplex TaxID=1478 RepID=UPI00162996C9|nr:hypothetical protein [Peribacillus simplex]